MNILRISKWLVGIVIVLCLVPCFRAFAADEADLGSKPGRISLAQELIRELVTLDAIQQQAIKDLAENPSNMGQLATGIRNSTRVSYEINSSLGLLESLSLGGQGETFKDALLQLQQQRIAVHQEMLQIAKKMMAGPEPGVNYGALAARMPELTATLEHIDKTTFNVAKGVFMLLIDNSRTDSRGNLAYLIVPTNKRQEMKREIQAAFGSRLNDKNANYIVLSAWVLDYGLSKDLKSSDEK
jgi:hypothetical protein